MQTEKKQEFNGNFNCAPHFIYQSSFFAFLHRVRPQLVITGFFRIISVVPGKLNPNHSIRTLILGP